MGSITVAQAALFAAIAMLLLTGFYLIDDLVLIENAPALVLLGSVVPSAIWAGFFFVLYGKASFARTAAWITLIGAVLLEALVAYLRYQQSVSYWTPFGDALSLSGWLLRLAWAVFLIAFALAPDNPRTRMATLVLAILCGPSTVSAAYEAFNKGIGLLVDDMPREALWRVLITPAIRTIYWLSQILFLWTAWGKPDAQDSIRASPSRLGL